MTRRLALVLVSGLLLVGGGWFLTTRSPAAPAPASLPPPTSAAAITTTVPTVPLPDGIRVEVGDDLQEAIDAHPPGTTFILAAGTHRLQVAVPKEGDRFFGESGAILSGAVIVSEFTEVAGTWIAEGQTQERGPTDLRCIEGYSGCQYTEDVFIDGVMLWQVTDLDDLEPGTFFFDYPADRIHLADNPEGRVVEASQALSAAFDGPAADVHIEGLIVQMYQTGIRAFDGDRWTITGNEVRLNHGNGIRGGDFATITDNFTHHNGAYGMSAYRAENMVVRGNDISYNNTAGFEAAWDAGGTKFAECTGILIQANHVHHNFGTGLWVDGAGIDVIYEDNLVELNERHGISHEISYATVIRNNIVRDNGLYGIYISGSPDAEVTGNQVTGNGDRAIWGFYDPVRGDGPLGPYELRNLYVHDNVIESTTGITGIDHKGSAPEIFAGWNNRFENNTYQLAADARLFLWDGRTLTFAEWQAQGNDVSGSRIDP